MAETSKISWTKATWNPWLGCTKVSSGCVNCYAELSRATKGRAASAGGPVGWGPGQPRQRVKGWGRPLAMDRKAGRENIITPIFPSLCDIFDVDPSQRENLDQWRDELFDVIEKTPNLVWLILTKRPEIAALPRWRDRIAACGANLWIGVSTENQATADVRVPLLLQIPTTNRFISAEPLLGPLDLTPWLSDLAWVIVGGESGKRPKKKVLSPSDKQLVRPMDLGWARRVRDDCRDKTLFFFKQIGGTDKAHGGELLDGEKIQQSPDFAGIVLAARSPASAQPFPIMANSTPTTPNTPAPVPPLSEEEKAYLQEREEIVVEDLQTNIKTGLRAARAMYEIQEYKGGILWNKNFNSCAAFCMVKWGYGQSQAYAQIETGKFLSSDGILVQPANPGQLRELIKDKTVPGNMRVECWNWMVAEAEKERKELTVNICDELVWKYMATHGLADAARLAEKRAKQEQTKVTKAVEVLREIIAPENVELPSLLEAIERELTEPERLQMNEAQKAQAHSALERLKELMNQHDAGICQQIQKHLEDLDASVAGFDERVSAFQALKQACEPVARRVWLSKRLDDIFGPPPRKTSPVSHPNQKSVTNSQSGRRGSSSSAKSGSAFPDFY